MNKWISNTDKLSRKEVRTWYAKMKSESSDPYGSWGKYVSHYSASLWSSVFIRTATSAGHAAGVYSRFTYLGLMRLGRHVRECILHTHTYEAI